MLKFACLSLFLCDDILQTRIMSNLFFISKDVKFLFLLNCSVAIQRLNTEFQMNLIYATKHDRQRKSISQIINLYTKVST